MNIAMWIVDLPEMDRRSIREQRDLLLVDDVVDVGQRVKLDGHASGLRFHS